VRSEFRKGFRFFFYFTFPSFFPDPLSPRKRTWFRSPFFTFASCPSSLPPSFEVRGTRVSGFIDPRVRGTQVDHFFALRRSYLVFCFFFPFLDRGTGRVVFFSLLLPTHPEVPFRGRAFVFFFGLHNSFLVSEARPFSLLIASLLFFRFNPFRRTLLFCCGAPMAFDPLAADQVPGFFFFILWFAPFHRPFVFFFAVFPRSRGIRHFPERRHPGSAAVFFLFSFLMPFFVRSLSWGFCFDSFSTPSPPGLMQEFGPSQVKTVFISWDVSSPLIGV